MEEEGNSKHAPHYTTLHRTTPHTMSHYTPPHYTALHHTLSHYTTHYVTPHPTRHRTTPHTTHHTTRHYTTHNTTPRTPHYTACPVLCSCTVPPEEFEELLKKQKTLLKRNPKATVVWLPKGGGAERCVSCPYVCVCDGVPYPQMRSQEKGLTRRMCS